MRDQYVKDCSSSIFISTLSLESPVWNAQLGTHVAGGCCTEQRGSEAGVGIQSQPWRFPAEWPERRHL